MLKQSFSKMKRILTILLAILLAVPLTAVLSSVHHYAGGPIQTYSTDQQPAQITTDEVPAYWHNGVPVFTEEPHGINTGTIEILDNSESPRSPEDGKYLIKKTDEFVTDIKSWYPDYTTEEISAAVELLQANGCKLPTATTT